MNGVGWLILLAIGVPLLGFLVWFLLDESLVQVPSGELGLVVVRGKATDKALRPGRHFVPAFRRRSVVSYPSLELAYRAGDALEAAGLERSGPPLRVVLGDRTSATVAYRLRFRLHIGALKQIHERFGPDGIWAAVRDRADTVLTLALGDPEVRVDDFYGAGRRILEDALRASLRDELDHDGFELVLFSLGEADLGRAGDAVEAATRARFELEREEAEASVRLARVRNDAELLPYLQTGPSDAALRYRETDLWRDVVQQVTRVGMPVQPAPPARAAAPADRTEVVDRPRLEALEADAHGQEA